MKINGMAIHNFKSCLENASLLLHRNSTKGLDLTDVNLEKVGLPHFCSHLFYLGGPDTGS